MNIVTSGIRIAVSLLSKYTAPNNAIAAIGVKLGMCGNKRLIAATKIAEAIKRKRGVISLFVILL
jgi:hypothetical protein